MNVSITPEIEKRAQFKLESDHYSSASDVVSEALRLMDQLDLSLTALNHEAREKIAAGMASLRAGLGVDGDGFLEAMDLELAELEGRTPA